MLRRSRKGSSPAGEEELPPPPAVIPWRVPPMGSLGDAWDKTVELPEFKPSPPPPKPKVRRRPGMTEVVFVEYVPPLHWAVVGAWVFLALAAVSTGPAYGLMSLMGLGAVICGVTAGLLMRSIQRTYSGELLAWIAAGLGFGIILLDAWRPSAMAYETYFRKSARVPVTQLDYEARLEYAERAMALMARTAFCAYEAMGNEAIAVGRDSVNRDVTADPEYFGISTLAAVRRDDLEGLEAEYAYYRPGDLPRDPYARDPSATFGVYITPTHVIVFSMGPDGKWQINPRLPVDPFSADPAAKLAPVTFDRDRGPAGEGDLILVVPIAELEELTGLCEHMRGLYRKFVESGELPAVEEMQPPEVIDYW